MILLVRGASPRLRFTLYRERPHQVETGITVHDLPAHVFAAGE